MPEKIVLFAFVFFASVFGHGQTIPSYRTTNWTNPGNTVYLRNNYPQIINVTSYGALGNGTHIDDTAILSAIAALTANGGIVYLPAGTYLIKRSIALPKKVTLRGDGSGTTLLKFNLGGSGHCITATGTESGSTYNLSGSSPIGRAYIDAPGHNFVTGNWIRIHQSDSNFINDSWSSNYVGQICKIDSINGNRIYLNRPLRVYLSATQTPKCIKIIPADSVGIEDLRITRRDATSGQTFNINLTCVTDSWIYGVQSDSCNFAHVTLDKCSNVLIYGCYFSTAFAYGSGGQAYGIATQFATGQCLVENNIFRRLRHSMLLQACANGNVFGYNYSLDQFQSGFFPTLTSEIVLHGNYNYMNLFEGNICTNIIVDNSHGKNGIYNTFLRNRASGTSVGIYMSSSTSDSQNYVGNEIGNFTMAGTGNFQYNNNKNGTYYASGTTSLSDTSYYLDAIPTWWNISGNWPSIGGANTLNSGSNPAKERYNGTGIETIALGNGSALPVTWLSFNTYKKEDKVLLKWQTASETNTDIFEVESSSNGRFYNKIHTEKAAGNSNEIKSYSFTDPNPFSPLTYYRIKQSDFDGKFSYSDIRVINIRNTRGFVLFPNPSNGEINLNFETSPNKTSLKIFDPFGKLVMEQKAGSLSIINKWDFGFFSNGFYYVEINNGNEFFHEYLIIKK